MLYIAAGWMDFVSKELTLTNEINKLLKRNYIILEFKTYQVAVPSQ